MTADDVVDAALSRCTDLGATVPTTRSVYYRRLGIRQAALFSRIGEIHPHYYGVSSTVALTAGGYNLAGLNPKAERVMQVLIANGGTSGLATGTEVNLVLLDDVDAMLAPRAVIRNNQLAQVANDLAGVLTVTIHYAKQPTATITGTTAMELPEQFQDLLVVDLSRQMIGKLLDVEPTRRDGWISILSTEESELLASLDNHVRHFVGGEQRRFRPATIPSAAADNG